MPKRHVALKEYSIGPFKDRRQLCATERYRLRLKRSDVDWATRSCAAALVKCRLRSVGAEIVIAKRVQIAISSVGATYRGARLRSMLNLLLVHQVSDWGSGAAACFGWMREG